MSVFNRNNVKIEFLNFLRNSDIFSTGTRGVTTKTDSGTTSETGDETITLAETGVKNIRSVSYDSSSLSYGTGYTIDLDNNQVTLLSIATGKSYEIQYDYGSGDKLYMDYPRPDLTLSSYPRLGFDIYGLTSEIGGFGNVNVTGFIFNVNIYTTSKSNAESYGDSLRSAIVNGQTSLYHVSYIRPNTVSQIQPIEARGKNKIYMINMEIRSENNYEIN